MKYETASRVSAQYTHKATKGKESLSEQQGLLIVPFPFRGGRGRIKRPYSEQGNHWGHRGPTCRKMSPGTPLSSNTKAIKWQSLRQGPLSERTRTPLSANKLYRRQENREAVQRAKREGTAILVTAKELGIHRGSARRRMATANPATERIPLVQRPSTSEPTAD